MDRCSDADWQGHREHLVLGAGGNPLEVATVNGETGLCIRDGNRLTAVMSIATDGERAALEWTEAVTRLGDTHVPDEIYERVAAQFDEAELVVLTFAVIVINCWNRLAVSFRAQAGSYQPTPAAV